MLVKRFWVFSLLALWLFGAFQAAAAAQGEAPLVLELAADGAVTPSMAEYLRRGIRQAEQRGAELLVFELNTPGGSVELMQEIVEDMLASPVPIVVYVYPRGAMAARKQQRFVQQTRNFLLSSLIRLDERPAKLIQLRELGESSKWPITVTRPLQLTWCTD